MLQLGEATVVDVDESLAQVKRLLGLLPGIELAWARKTPAFIRLGLAIHAPCAQVPDARSSAGLKAAAEPRVIYPVRRRFGQVTRARLN